MVEKIENQGENILHGDREKSCSFERKIYPEKERVPSILITALLLPPLQLEMPPPPLMFILSTPRTIDLQLSAAQSDLDFGFLNTFSCS